MNEDVASRRMCLVQILINYFYKFEENWKP